ncbi:polyprotein [Arachis hypogaea]|nr:polyprotein [Arachis hypogaea]
MISDFMKSCLNSSALSLEAFPFLHRLPPPPLLSILLPISLPRKLLVLSNFPPNTISLKKKFSSKISIKLLTIGKYSKSLKMSYIPYDNKRKLDYIIRIAKNNIPLGPDFVEEFHLLTKQSVREYARHYRYLHIGCVQVAVKPLIREGLNASILMCLRGIRHNDFQDSLIGTVKTSLGYGPVYFNCFPNKTISLLDLNILDSLFLNIRIHGLNMKEGSIPAALIYRIQYKVMNTCNSRDLLKSQDRETTLFVTDMTKANVMISRL